MSDPTQKGRENFQKNKAAVARVIRFLEEAVKEDILIGEYQDTRELQRAATCLSKVLEAITEDGPSPCYPNQIVTMSPPKVRKGK